MTAAADDSIVPNETAEQADPAPGGRAPATHLVYGAMALGGSWDQTPLTDDVLARGFEALEAAVDAGFRNIDLADIYAAGKSETVVGQWLAQRPSSGEDVRIQTKAGIRIPEVTAAADAPVHYRLDEAVLRGGLETSLTRLGVHSVDRFLIHRWDPLADPAEVATILDGLVDEGLTRSIGISNVSWYRMELLQRHLVHPLEAVQVQLSLGHADFVERQILWDHPDGAAVNFSEPLLEECAASGIEVQAWGSLDRGRYCRPHPEPDDAATAAVVRDVAAELGGSPEAVVLAWLLRLPQRIRPVVGTTDPQRIRDCALADALAARMTHEHWYALFNSARGANVP